MSSNNECDMGTVRVLFDQFKINSREIEAAVVGGLTNAGFDVEIEPEVAPGSVLGRTQEPGGSIIKVYRKVSRW